MHRAVLGFGLLAVLWLAGCGESQPVGERSSPAGVAYRNGWESTAAPADSGGPSAAAEATPVVVSDGSAEFGEPAGAELASAARPAAEMFEKSDRSAAVPASESAPAPIIAPRRDPRPAQPPLPTYQSGTLTAGSIDDHTRYDEFQSYLSRALQSGRAGLPQIAVGTRVLIEVRTAAGEPVGDALVRLYRAAADGQQAGNGEPVGTPIFETATRSDGHALFLSQLDAAGGGREFVLSVADGDNARPVTHRVSLDQTPWTVVLPDAQPRLPQALDLALCIDTTGSMGDELEYLKVEIDSIAAAVRARFPEVDQRYGLILYRDEGDEYVSRTVDFTSSLPDFRRRLAEQSAAGGGDYPEAMHVALEQAGQLSWRTSGTARVLFLVADAPPHSDQAQRTLAAVQALRRQGVTVFPVAASGVRDEAEFVMRLAAFLSRGQYLFLTDHSGVGNAHAKPQTPSYSVERLDQLMIRMIASQLAGRPVLPQEIIATEQGDDGRPPLPIEQNQTHIPRVPRHAGSITAESASADDLALIRWSSIALGAVLLIGAEVVRRRTSA